MNQITVQLFNNKLASIFSNGKGEVGLEVDVPQQNVCTHTQTLSGSASYLFFSVYSKISNWQIFVPLIVSILVTLFASRTAVLLSILAN
jgi:hypothetical protein